MQGKWWAPAQKPTRTYLEATHAVLVDPRAKAQGKPAQLSRRSSGADLGGMDGSVGERELVHAVKDLVLPHPPAALLALAWPSECLGVAASPPPSPPNGTGAL